MSVKFDPVGKITEKFQDISADVSKRTENGGKILFNNLQSGADDYESRLRAALADGCELEATDEFTDENNNKRTVTNKLATSAEDADGTKKGGVDLTRTETGKGADGSDETITQHVSFSGSKNADGVIAQNYTADYSKTNVVSEDEQRTVGGSYNLSVNGNDVNASVGTNSDIRTVDSDGTKRQLTQNTDISAGVSDTEKSLNYNSSQTLRVESNGTVRSNTDEVGIGVRVSDTEHSANLTLGNTRTLQEKNGNTVTVSDKLDASATRTENGGSGSLTLEHTDAIETADGTKYSNADSLTANYETGLGHQSAGVDIANRREFTDADGSSIIKENKAGGTITQDADKEGLTFYAQRGRTEVDADGNEHSEITRIEGSAEKTITGGSSASLTLTSSSGDTSKDGSVNTATDKLGITASKSDTGEERIGINAEHSRTTGDDSQQITRTRNVSFNAAPEEISLNIGTGKSKTINHEDGAADTNSRNLTANLATDGENISAGISLTLSSEHKDAPPKGTSADASDNPEAPHNSRSQTISANVDGNGKFTLGLTHKTENERNEIERSINAELNPDGDKRIMAKWGIKF